MGTASSPVGWIDFHYCSVQALVMIEDVNTYAMLKRDSNLNINAGGPTRYYYSIIQQLFKIVPRYRFEKAWKITQPTVTASILLPSVSSKRSYMLGLPERILSARPSRACS